jgi:hypothetical protein
MKLYPNDCTLGEALESIESKLRAVLDPPESKIPDMSKITGTAELIRGLCFLVHTNAKAHGFWEVPNNFGEKVSLAHSELSEALEAFREDSCKRDPKLPEHTAVAVELADAVIRIFDLAEGFGYDIASALSAKMEYNITRPHKHGKRF